MTSPRSSARERILDAYQACLNDLGERAATLDAVAAAAGVSKGGLIYHFASKEALAAGLVERLERLGRDDVEAMGSTAESAVGHFIRSAAHAQSPFGLTAQAVQTLARSGHVGAVRTMHALEQEWYDVLLRATGDRVVARMAQLVGDGIYYNAALAVTEPATVDPDETGEPGEPGEPEAHPALPSPAEQEDLVRALLRMIDD